jgi:hypothetical protein
MSNRSDRRAQLRRLYGFDFPDDLFAFWDFVNRLQPLAPLQALADVSGIHLVGPFEVMAGRFDGRTPQLPLSLHWRYHDDPPEFFTVLATGNEGLHWGYYLDDPATGQGCVASYRTNTAFEITPDADSLFEVLRLELERLYRDCQDFREEDPASAYEYGIRLAQIETLRARLPRFSTRERPETGADYEDAYPERSARSALVVAATKEGMGIVVPRKTYRPLSLKDKFLWRQLRKEEDPADLVAEARQALGDGFAGTALKLGKDLWAIGGERRLEYAFELLDAAYESLGRNTLRDVLRTHREHRDLASVDILENEARGTGHR